MKIYTSFRPLWGFLFIQLMYQMSKILYLWFPSPLGISLYSIFSFNVIYTFMKVSVPSGDFSLFNSLDEAIEFVS